MWEQRWEGKSSLEGERFESNCSSKRSQGSKECFGNAELLPGHAHRAGGKSCFCAAGTAVPGG